MPASITSRAYPASATSLASLHSRLSDVAGRVWRFLILMGAHRAAPHILAIAAQYDERDPALARQLREHVRISLHG
jgi:hypothetical protein